jgi:FtsP/CotA-like multicopper oxidase with cupredoxin domain
MNISRRRFVQSTLAVSSVALLPRCTLVNLSGETDNGETDKYVYHLTAEPSTAELVPGFKTDVLGFNGSIPAPEIRCRQGQPVTIHFTNRLDEPTTIHWHGLRIPIEMDGVPFLSQPPIMPGETFTYQFTPPDAGTFWYHPHMNSVKQLGMGLVGLIVVEEAQPVRFDNELSLALKHWHLDNHGAWKSLMIPRYSARMGTPGEWATVNGEHDPIYSVLANGSTRLRIANVDNTLTYPIHIEGVDAWIIAIDGNPVSTPLPLEKHLIGPGMRVDIGFTAPAHPHRIEVQYLKGRFKFPLCSIEVVESPFEQAHPLPRLPLNPIPQIDLTNVSNVDFVFEWAGAISPVGEDGKASPIFWLTNKRAWEGMSATSIPEPLAQLDLGKTYLFTLKNLTQYHHPIHLHGHTFLVLELNGEKVEQPFHTDTVLLGKNGTAKAAFVANNPGRWMYHCHVIEHMKTGLMGFVEVS